MFGMERRYTCFTLLVTANLDVSNNRETKKVHPRAERVGFISSSLALIGGVAETKRV